MTTQLIPGYTGGEGQESNSAQCAVVNTNLSSKPLVL